MPSGRSAKRFSHDWLPVPPALYRPLYTLNVYWGCLVLFLGVWTCILDVWICFGCLDFVFVCLYLFHISSFCLWGLPPSGESIFRIPIFLNSSFCLRGLPFRGIHLQNPDLFEQFCLRGLLFGGSRFKAPYFCEQFFLSAGPPLLGNSFSGFWLVWTVLSVSGVSLCWEFFFRSLTFC